MRRYFNADGNPVSETGKPAATSKGCQGPLAGCLLIILALFIIGAVIIGLAHH